MIDASVTTRSGGINHSSVLSHSFTSVGCKSATINGILIHRIRDILSMADSFSSVGVEVENEVEAKSVAEEVCEAEDCTPRRECLGLDSLEIKLLLTHGAVESKSRQIEGIEQQIHMLRSKIEMSRRAVERRRAEIQAETRSLSVVLKSGRTLIHIVRRNSTPILSAMTNVLSDVPHCSEERADECEWEVNKRIKAMLAMGKALDEKAMIVRVSRKLFWKHDGRMLLVSKRLANSAILETRAAERTAETLVIAATRGLCLTLGSKGEEVNGLLDSIDNLKKIEYRLEAEVGSLLQTDVERAARKLRRDHSRRVLVAPPPRDSSLETAAMTPIDA